MTLEPGARWGPYEILSSLGEGGMGEVYRARDTRLQRDVAIKVLPRHLANDPERLARLGREARLLAALNHPNVAAIYGLEEIDGSPSLVMECVEGVTLAHRLAADPLPVDEALPIAVQIAAGLEAAHEAGVIHRDLKPANVMIRPDGSVKILDLGLARVVEPAAASTDPSLSPTVTSAPTGTGVILGTAAYMSPEQARGRPVDKRSDIFSFGCVLYESLTGMRAFPGESVSDSLAAILRAEPDWGLLPADAPAVVRALLRRCLQKDPKRRLHDIADARIELEEGLSRAGEAAQEIAPLAVRGRGQLPWAIAALLLGAAAGALLYRSLAQSASPATPSIRTVLHLPADTGVSLPGGPFAASFPAGAAVAISPDGRTVVFRGTKQGVSRLYRRRLDRDEAEPITGTENGFAPFFSPDGQWLGFFTPGELKKVPIEGGAALLICSVPPVTAGGAWDTDGSIVYTRAVNGSLYRVSSGGGEPQPLTTLDAARGEHAHLWPQILPKGRGILVSIVLGKDFQDYSSSQIVVLDPKSGSRRVVLEGSTFARYSGGWLVFVRGGEVSAAPFDVENRRVMGPAVRAPEPITLNAADGSASLALSPQGDLVYVSGPPLSVPNSTVLRLDPNGRETPLSLPPSHYFSPRLASDGRRLAITRCEGYACRVFVYDLAREILSPLTPEPGRFFCPAWSADGSLLAFSVLHKSDPKVGLKTADGSGALTTSRWTEDAELPNSFSPDGRTLAFTVVYTADRGGSRKRFTTDIWLAPLEGKSAARPWFESPFRESAAAFSPDGRWIAYVSDESGRHEVYVRPFPGPGGKVKVSSEGGAEPVWIRGGRQINYRAPDGMMSVDVGLEPELSVGKPRLLFVTNLSSSDRADHPWEYDVSPDGAFFVGTRANAPDEPERRLALVTNWLATLGATESRK